MLSTVAEEQAREVSLAVRELLQSARQMQSAAARQLGVNVTDVQAMDLITSGGGKLSPRELATRLGIRTSSASALIDRLESAGHLQRTTADDRPQPRSTRTRLVATPHARQEVREVLHDINTGFADLAASLSDDEAMIVLDFLRRGRQILQDYADGAEGKP